MRNAPESKTSNLAGAGVLIVDAAPADTRQLSVLLHRAGCRVSTASSAEQAGQRITSGRPDLILTEVVLQGPDGYALCQGLKQDPSLRLIPVVFLSGRGKPDDKLRAFAAGAVDYVTKPFNEEELLARLNAHLAVTKLTRALEQERAAVERERAAIERERAANAQLQSDAASSQQQVALVFGALADVLPGRVLDGKYRIDSKLGSGGFGVVYKAEQISLKRAVALKIFLPAKSGDQRVHLTRFLREGVSTGRLNHPNVVSVFESGTSAEGIPFLAMELLKGWTLREEMHTGKPLSLVRCQKIIEPICDALACAHAAHVIHRDIKPENIFLHQSPTGEVVKILDFGIALLREPGGSGQREPAPLTKPGHLIGTPSYMAPERLRSGPDVPPIDGRADVFSVGVMIFEVLTGQTPFGGDRSKPVDVLVRQLTAEPLRLRQLAPELPEELEVLILRTLSRDPEKRPTAQDLLMRWRELMREAIARSGLVPALVLEAESSETEPTQRVDTAQVELELPAGDRT